MLLTDEIIGVSKVYTFVVVSTMHMHFSGVYTYKLEHRRMAASGRRTRGARIALN